MALSRGGSFTLAFVAFLAVFREGAETALFFQALISGTSGTLMPVVAGIGTGVVTLAVVFSLFYRFGVRIPLRPFFAAFPKDAHPMAILSSVVCALSTYYAHDDETSPEGFRLSMYRLMGKLPTIASYGYKKLMGLPFNYPQNALGFTQNFLQQMFAVPAEPYEVDPVVARALDVLFILHADHEQNCSTSTVRLVGSSQANLFVSISAGEEYTCGIRPNRRSECWGRRARPSQD